MNTEGTPTRGKQPVKGVMMSTSLKERLKRCGRYHASSPTATPQERSYAAPPQSSPSSSPPSLETKPLSLCQNSSSSSSSSSLHKLNPVKRKVDLLMHKNCSDNDVSCTPENTLPGKTKVAKNSSGENTDFHAGENVLIKKKNGSFKDCSQQEIPQDMLNGSVPETATCSGESEKSSDSLEKSSCSNSKGHAFKSGSDSGNEESLSSQLQYSDSVLKAKLELLRKLKMVKMYREKNDLTELQQLIDRWRSVSQAALTDLLSLHPEPRSSMGDLISHLQIDPELVQFDAEEQDFH